MWFLLTLLALILLISSSNAQERYTISWKGEMNRRLSAETIVTREMKQKVEQKLMLPSGENRKEQREGLNKLIGNTIFALTFDGFKLWDKLEPYYRDAIYNGMLCDNITTDSEDKLREILYGNEIDVITREHRREEKSVAEDPLFGINCTSTSPDQCFCKERKLLVYCLALRMERKINDTGFTKKKCEPEIFEPLLRDFNLELRRDLNDDERNAIQEIAKLGVYDLYDQSGFIEDVLNGEHTALESADVPQLICEATTPRAANYVKESYAANPLRYMLERNMYTVHGPMRMNVYAACLTNLNFTSTELGSCLCALDRGFSYCFFNVLSKFVQQKGFLNCETLSFNRTIEVDISLAFTMPASSTTNQWFLSAAIMIIIVLYR